ncbi:MAG: VOC family protein [Chloroflexi bacterium]|nr:VOC family protein [Chloroflexota bacterium]MCC6895947.1 VOC family protein [Anaerolineae bacterium]
MPKLYPSWIEIPVKDLERATAFYRAVFGLTDTPLYDDPPAKIVVLLASDKSIRQPGVSLVLSPLHHPADGGVVINFHVDTHAALAAALEQVKALGGKLDHEMVDMDDGVHYINLLDCEGNRIALSSYEEIG